MPVPTVSIVGRPNVGKSSLLNWLAARRISIVDPTAGVTRDRVATFIDTGDRVFELVDTGGIGIEDVDRLTADVERQVGRAIDQASLILFVVDVRSGVTPLDEEVSLKLRRIDKPVILVANKCDTEGLAVQSTDFFSLGWGKPLCVSAEQKIGKKDLLQAIVKRLPPDDGDAPPKEVNLKLAIVGRRNVGKSTFINSLADSERVIVSEVAGTTRDSIDVRFERDGKTFIAIDTAGVRKKKSIGSDIEFYSLARAERSIRRADIVLMFFDPRLRVSQVDKKLTDYILQQQKPAIFVINKWDLVVGQMPTERMGEYIRRVFPMLDYVPIAFITAKNGKNVQALLNLAQNLHKQASARVTTGDLNRIVEEALATQAPPMRQNRRPKIYFSTQVATNPPTIVLFSNGAQLFDNTYQRYLLKFFRDHLPFHEVPIKLYIRSKNQSDSIPEAEEGDVPRPNDRPRTKRLDAPPPERKKRPRKDTPGESDVWRDL